MGIKNIGDSGFFKENLEDLKAFKENLEKLEKKTENISLGGLKSLSEHFYIERANPFGGLVII